VQTGQLFPAELGARISEDAWGSVDDLIAEAYPTEDLIRGQLNLFGSIEVTAVMDALHEVKRWDKRVHMLEGQLRNARENRKEAIASCQSELAKLLASKATGHFHRQSEPSLGVEVKRALQKNQRAARRVLEKQIPADLKVAMDRHGWRFHRAKADECFEYMELRRQRQKALTTLALQANIRKVVDQVAKSGVGWPPPEECVDRAIRAAEITIADFARSDARPKLEDEKTPNTIAELLRVYGAVSSADVMAEVKSAVVATSATADEEWEGAAPKKLEEAASGQNDENAPEMAQGP
jgi:hypothetical protein